MSDEDGKGDGDNVLFALFIFSVLMIILVPTTIWRLCSGGGGSTNVIVPWQKAAASRGALQRKLNRFNILLICAWCALLALGLYISSCTMAEDETFDPFAILEIPMTADEKAIKRAYRMASKKYHPDKVSDPQLKKEYAQYFAEKISKAYQTLTDEAARENWIKHGHPDGPQAMSIGIALPSFFFTTDKTIAPIVLLILAFCGLALPILGLALYLWHSEGYIGMNKVSQQTITYYQRFGVKEMLKVSKMPEALVAAQEFVRLPFKREHETAFQKYLQHMRSKHDITALPKWWRPEILRAYLFILSYATRCESEVPKELRPEFKETLRLLPILCEEFVKASASARNRMLRGWFVPAEAAVQMQQCVLQQMNPAARIATTEDKKKKKLTGTPVSTLLQLPGIEEDVLRQLHSNGVKKAEELAGMSDSERKDMLDKCGFEAAQLAALERSLLALPHAHITSVKAFVDGEDDIKEQDMLTVQLHIAITRGVHAGVAGAPASNSTAVVAPGKFKAVRAHTPRYPHLANEKWHIFVTNQRVNTPSTWIYKPVELLTADAAGAEHFHELGCRWAGVDGSGTAGTSGDGPIGQKLEFKLLLPEPGKFNLTVVAMPSCWIGCDVTAPLNLHVLKQTVEEKMGKSKGSRSTAKKAASTADDASDGDDSDKNGDDSDTDESEGWDTDETGTDITHFSDDEATSAVDGATAEPQGKDAAATKVEAKKTK